MISASMQFPIDAVLPQLIQTLKNHTSAVLSAEPGAGKTTRVPLALMQAGFSQNGKILMLEPRRLAAVRAAEYMASQLNESVGQSVGYRIRGESKLSASTRIEVVTEGVLTRLLQDDPALEAYSTLIFDEFHERSIHADLGLALSLESQQTLREDLRILVMSATLDGVAVSQLMNNAPVVASEGRCFPVDIVYAGVASARLEEHVKNVTLRALREHGGDVLVFLPGQREIRRVHDLLTEAGTDAMVHMLFGDASWQAQQAAIKPDAHGKRKIILATAIAETSLTIDGVRVVIDSGLVRVSRFDPKRGMAGLVTTQVSQATSEQRRGRAGRTQAGVCYRLWTETQQQALAKFPTPELLSTDLAPFALEMAQWGISEVQQLRLLDLPPQAHLQQAQDLLQFLDALDQHKKLTEHGKAMARLPVHPRFAHMLLRAQAFHQTGLACDVAALLEERDILRGADFRDVDFHGRYLALKHGGAVDHGARERVKSQSARLQKLMNGVSTAADENFLGVLLALAFPERLAKQRAERSLRYQTVAGVGVNLPEGAALHKSPWLAIAQVDGVGSDARIFTAADISYEQIRTHFSDHIRTETEGFWDEKTDTLVARTVERLGVLILSEKPTKMDDTAKSKAVLGVIRQLGLSVLSWSEKASQLKARVEWLRTHGELSVEDLKQIPDVSDRHLLVTLESWLAPYVQQVSRKAHLAQLDVYPALSALFDYPTLQRLESLAPATVTAPTGTAICLDYSQHPPVMAVRIQEVFGLQETPRLNNGKVAVSLHLLSPAKQPLAVTQDLKSFWQNAWNDVRKDMRGQYPKHYWPEDPLQAEPTRRSKAADDRARKRNA